MDITTIEKQISEGLNMSEIASQFGISVRTLSRWMSNFGISYNKIKAATYPNNLTSQQFNMITGSLLGDGWLAKHGRSKNARFRFKQCSRFLSYVEFLRDVFLPFMSSNNEVRTEFGHRPYIQDGKILHNDKEFCKAFSFWTVAHPVFTELWSKWYDNGRKIIPKDLKLNAQILSHWFVQDGSNGIKSIRLYTNAFTIDEVVFLKDILQRDLGILASHCKAQTGQYIVRIGSRSYFDFIDMVDDEVKKFGCFDYKIDTSKAPEDRKGEVWYAPKLTLEQAREIRYLRSQGMKLKDIAKMYGVKASTIGKIVNNQMYKEKMKLSGSADVKLGVKYGN